MLKAPHGTMQIKNLYLNPPFGTFILYILVSTVNMFSSRQRLIFHNFISLNFLSLLFYEFSRVKFYYVNLLLNSK